MNTPECMLQNNVIIVVFHTGQCDALPPLINGTIMYSPDMTAPYLEGTNASHICNPGFALIGNMTRVCQNDTTFSGEPPMCLRKLYF